MVTNSPATLTKEAWIHLDNAIIKTAKPRLRVVNDLRAAGLQYMVPGGLGKTVLQSQSMSDIGGAKISMDGITQGDADRPQFDIVNLPLPIIHKDFHYSAREIQASRNGGAPLDTTSAELAARKVAEEIEKLTIGENNTYTYGGGTIYGLKNYNNVLTQSLTTPGTNATTVAEVLAMRQKSMNNGYYGPWMLYYSPAWGAYMNADYSTAKGDNTLLDRLKKIDGITNVQQADYLTGTCMILVQMTPDVARVVIGMDITTVQWESMGGMMINFKVMAIIVPQIRCDYSSQTGIVYGNVA
jgi:uncharacterized linocin/CFP29 family protein